MEILKSLRYILKNKMAKRLLVNLERMFSLNGLPSPYRLNTYKDESLNLSKEKNFIQSMVTEHDSISISYLSTINSADVTPNFNVNEPL